MAYPAQLGDIEERIGSRLQDSSFQSVAQSDVLDYINQSLAYYKFRRYWFNERFNNSIVLTQGNPIITAEMLPADFLQELPNGGLSIPYSVLVYRLTKVSSDIYDSDNVQAVGIPYQYCYRQQQFELYFFPNINYPLNLRYLCDYNPFVELTDTNDFLKYADRMITYNSLSRIYGEAKQDPKMEAYYTARANDEEKNLLKRSSALTGTGRNTIDSHLIGN